MVTATKRDDQREIRENQREKQWFGLAQAAVFHVPCCRDEMHCLPGLCRPRPREEQLIMLGIQRSTPEEAMFQKAVQFWVDFDAAVARLPWFQRVCVELLTQIVNDPDGGGDDDYDRDLPWAIALQRRGYGHPPDVAIAYAKAGLETIAADLRQRSG